MGKLLLVEDEAPIRTLMRMALTTAGYAALEMSDGRALIETLEQGGIDLILLDVMLPGEDGFTLLDKKMCIRDRFNARSVIGAPIFLPVCDPLMMLITECS